MPRPIRQLLESIAAVCQTKVNGVRRSKFRRNVVESLETRELLAATVQNTGISSNGTVAATSTTLDVTFSEAITGGNHLANYGLRRAGVDGLLGSTDDVIVGLNAITSSGNTRTLNIQQPLVQDTYRLTVSDEITDGSSQPIDGDFNSIAGGDYVRDFLVGELLVAWGNNGGGQLGDGTTANHLLPASVQTLQGVISISAGWDHMLALKSDGTVWAWGYNAYGQLGDGTTVGKTNPIQVAGLSNVTAIAAGDNHSLALLSDGTVKAWGLNSSGAVGDGTTTNRTLPTAVSGLSNITSIAGGRDFSLALRSDGTVRSWGLNTFGALGDGTTTTRLAPVTVSGITNATAIAAGSFHAVALLSDSTVKAWGYNLIGQIGDGTTTNRLTPVAVTGLSGVTSVKAGYQHTLALRTDGTVRAWGYNQYSQLGDSTTTNRSTPVAVSGLSGVTKITTGGYHSFAILQDKSVRAWGWNDYGQLGDGTTTSRSTPVAIAQLQSAELISANGASSLAVRTQLSATNVRRGTSQADAALSAQSILLASPAAPSGVYWIDPTGGNTLDAYQVYADMTSLGGGWTQAIRANGNSSNFSYDSALWTTSGLLNPSSPGTLSLEHKNNAFNNLPYNQLMLNVVTGNASSNVIANSSGFSMLQVFQGDQFRATEVGRTTWVNAVPGAQLQNGYYAEGLNVKALTAPYNFSRARFGALGNQEPDLLSPDSFIGIGTSDNRTGVSVGNFYSAAGSGPYQNIPAVGSLYARDAIAPRIVSSSIAQSVLTPGSSSFDVTLTLSESVVNGANANVYKLVFFGGDDQFGTGDDVSIQLSPSVNGRSIRLTAPALPQGSFRLITKSGMNGLLDTAGNSLDGDNDGIAGGNWAQSFSVNQNPKVLAINRALTSSTISSSSAQFQVTFSEAVTGVDPTDFQIVTSGNTTASPTVTVSPTSSANNYTVTIGGISGSGTVGVSLVDNLSIRDTTGLGLISQGISYQPQQVTSTSASPYSVATADVNGDGRLDVIVPNSGSNSVGVLRGNGNGTYQGQLTTSVGGLPIYVASADLNNDGKSDLVIANNASGTIGVLRGNGDGTFQTMVPYTTGANPYAVAIGDVNNDGNSDIIVANYGADSLGYLRGNGDGSFQGMVVVATVSRPTSVALGDLNGDGILDIVNTTFTGGGSFSFLRGNGNGTFQPPVSQGTATSPIHITVSDLNSDGRLDVLVANNGSGSVGVFKGNGNGTFQTQSTYSVGSGPIFVAVGDANGDGISDLLTANNGDNSVSILPGSGTGTFQTQQTFSVGGNPHGATFADINNDGKADVVSANTSSATVSTLLNNNGSYTTGQTYTVLGQVVSTSFLASGTVTSGTSSITVTFNGPLTGIGIAANYQLQQAGTDGLLLTTDSVVSPASVVVSGNIATLNFATSFTEDVYRLTVMGTIADASGNGLDGDGDGLPAGNWRRDFVVDSRQTGLDSTFGSAGRATTTFSSGFDIDSAKSTAIQSDGKIVVAGYGLVAGLTQFALARYNTNGTLDTTFDSDGKVSTAIGTTGSAANSIAIQNDGKIVVAGYANNGSNYDFAVVRYNANGSLDATFDGDGKLLTSIGASDDYASSVAIQPDGKVVVFGDSVGGTKSDVALSRYNSNGTLDTSFSGDGKVTISIGNNYDYGGGDRSLALQSDGKIVVVGLSNSLSNTNQSDFAVVRFNSNGTLDSSFDGDGKLITDFGTTSDYALSVAIQNDGKLVVAGESYALDGTGNNFAVARYNPNGSLDTTFSGDGKLTTDFDFQDDVARSLLLQPDGKVLLTGSRTRFGSFDFALARYTANGSLDTSFDGDGKLTTDFGSAYDEAYSAALQSDGKIVVVGYGSNAATNKDFAVARYSETGSLQLSTQNGQSVTIDRDVVGTGQLNDGPNNAFDGFNRLMSVGNKFTTTAGSTGAIDDAGQTFVSATGNLAGVEIRREVTAPTTGAQYFIRTIEVATNSSGSPITVPLQFVGNLGSDAATTVFATSDGDNNVESTDTWFGTDDGDGTGSPALIHLLHGKYGLTPTTISVTEDNIGWTYNIVVAPGETKRLATFTIQGNTRAEAIASVNALISPNGFGGEAASFLSQTELGSLANFQFNQAPTNVSLSPASIGENQPIGTVVGTLSTTDPDAGDSHSYTFVTGSGGEGNGNFTIEGNTIKTAAAFNFEATPSFSILVQSTDQIGLSVVKSFTIQISNVNEAPANISLAGTTLPENAGLNFAIGSLSGTDPDAADLLTFSLPTGVGNNNLFNISGTLLRANNSFDFEAGSSYSITVRATDAGGLTFDKSFTITVSNVNEAPYDIQLSNNVVVENGPAGTYVGTLSTLDPDLTSAFTYTFVTGAGDNDNNRFAFNGNTVITTAIFNFEAQSSFSILVQSTDSGGLSVVRAITIQIQDVSETAVTRIWDGGGLTQNWSEAANWAADIAPVPGDRLIFPNFAAQMVATNDFPATSIFDSVSISGNGYTLNGNEFGIRNGIDVDGVNNAINSELRLQGSSTIVLSSGSLNLNGNIQTNTNVLTLDSTGTILVSGVISGSSNVNLFGSNEVILSGSNTYTGITTIGDGSRYGTVTLRNSSALGAHDGTGATGTVIASGYVYLEGGISVQNESLVSTTGISITSNSGSNAWSGAITGGGINIWNFSSGDLTINGSLTAGSGRDIDFQSAFGGRVLVGANVSASGGRILSPGFGNGKVSFLGNLSAATFHLYDGLGVTELAGTATVGSASVNGTLTGNGTIHASSVTVNGGRLQPGTESTAGRLQLDNLYIFSGGSDPYDSRYIVQLNGNQPGAGYDQISVAGTVNLGGNLIVTAGFAPALSDSFIIIDNDGTDAVVGQFLGLPEGAQVAVNGQIFRLSYIGGTGNDVTLRPLNQAPTDITLSSNTIAENLPVQSVVGLFSTQDPNAGGSYSYSLVAGDGSNDNASFQIAGATLKSNVVFNFEMKNSYSIRVQTTDQDGLSVEKIFTIQITNVTELGGIDVQFGQTQRSYVRYLDVLFDRPDDILSMINTGRINLTKKDLNGLSPVSVPLTPSMFSTVGNSARLDFGVNGLGGNRNTTAGDGYYELGVDMDGNGSFESKKYFYRLLGDVNGDRKVDSADSSLVTSSFGTTNAERDVNGDGTVNSNDRTLVLRSVGRKLKDDLFADD